MRAMIDQDHNRVRALPGASADRRRTRILCGVGAEGPR